MDNMSLTELKALHKATIEEVSQLRYKRPDLISEITEGEYKCMAIYEKIKEKEKENDTRE